MRVFYFEVFESDLDRDFESTLSFDKGRGLILIFEGGLVVVRFLKGFDQSLKKCSAKILKSATIKGSAKVFP